MTVGLAITAFVYAIVTVGVALAALMDWNLSRDAARDTDLSRYPDLHAKYERETHQAARKIVQAPLWPLFAIAAAGRIYRDSKEDL